MVRKQRRTVKKLHKRRNILKGYSKKKPHYIQKKSRRKKTSYKRKRPNKRTRGKRRKFILSGGGPPEEFVTHKMNRERLMKRAKWIADSAVAREDEQEKAARARATEAEAAAAIRLTVKQQQEEEEIISEMGDRLAADVAAAALSGSLEDADAARTAYSEFVTKTKVDQLAAVRGRQGRQILGATVATQPGVVQAPPRPPPRPRSRTPQRQWDSREEDGWCGERCWRSLRGLLQPSKKHS
jgi:hypothetical protein